MDRRAFFTQAGVATVLVAGGSVWRALDQGVFSTGQGPAYEPWHTWRREPIIGAAILAPSPHNSQPWLFRVADTWVELYLDTKRNTGALDPYLREAHLGLGCALENVALAARATGFVPSIWLAEGSCSGWATLWLRGPLVHGAQLATYSYPRGYMIPTLRLLSLLVLVLAAPLDAQLAAARAVAHAIPGDLPTSIGYLVLETDSTPLSDLVENAAKTKVSNPVPVFQVRFPHGWVMVDAGMDRATARRAGDTGVFLDGAYTSTVAALRGASLIVVTHEHYDHVATVVQSAVADELAPHTMLTRQQVDALVRTPKLISKLDSAKVNHYVVVDYDSVLPIAPGVVLIKAPGHTPGSQVIYVKLASGREVILSGDVAWHRLGIETETQKPDSIREDRGPIAGELKWLHAADKAGVAVVVSHDGDQLAMFAKSGVLHIGLTR
jgi:glyoxylase-like metal-dependent hydrolase (beta-lactamase superfamily II)